LFSALLDVVSRRGGVLCQQIEATYIGTIDRLEDNQQYLDSTPCENSHQSITANVDGPFR
jgi:hypothetical protein